MKRERLIRNTTYRKWQFWEPNVHREWRYEILQRRILFSGVRLVVSATEGWGSSSDRLIVLGGAPF